MSEWSEFISQLKNVSCIAFSAVLLSHVRFLSPGIHTRIHTHYCVYWIHTLSSICMYFLFDRENACWLKQERKFFGFGARNAKPSFVFKQQKLFSSIRASASSLDAGRFLSLWFILPIMMCFVSDLGVFDLFMFVGNGDRLEHWIGCCNGLQPDRSWHCCFRWFWKVAFFY